MDWWIIEKSLEEKLTPQEKKSFDEWLGSAPDHALLYDKIKSAGGADDDTAEFARWRQAFADRLRACKRWERRRTILRWTRVAAVVFLFLGCAYWWFFRETGVPAAIDFRYRESNRTMVRLTMGSGEVLELSSPAMSDTMEIHGGRIIKKQGTLIYDQVPDEPETGEVARIQTSGFPGGYQHSLPQPRQQCRG